REDDPYRKMIRELKSRGYQVATIKHTHHSLSFNEPHKDSWRHIQAGSEATALASPSEIVLVKPLAQNLTINEAAHLLGEDYDIVLTEGFKLGDAPKIEVHRKEIGPPFGDTKKLIAIATDEPLETKTRQFSLEDIKGMADLLEKDFIKPHRERISLYINNAPVPLITFPRQIITNVLLAIASSLKGVGKVESLEISLRRKPK
ncbi:unnamed protein product, partial [marine sediment metagenome]